MDPGIHELMHVTGVASVGIEIHKHPGGNEQSRATIRLNNFSKIPPSSDPGGQLAIQLCHPRTNLISVPELHSTHEHPIVCLFMFSVYMISVNIIAHILKVLSPLSFHNQIA